MHIDLHRAAAIGQVKPFDHMQFVRMRSLKTIDERAGVDADGVHHQCVAFVMADRFAIPGRAHGLGMVRRQIHMPDLMVALEQEHDLVGQLKNLHRRGQSEHIGHA